MKEIKILCVYDGYITKDIMSGMKELEKFGAHITMINDDQIKNVGDVTNRMLLLEQKGIAEAPTCRTLLENCSDKEILVVHCTSINKEILEACSKLQAVVVLRGGIENVDSSELAKRQIPLMNASLRSADAVSDAAVGMMIAENKNIARSHHYMKEGRWVKSYINQRYIRNMNKCTVGLIGYGAIGSRVAKKLKGFESQILVYDPFVSKEQIEKDGVKVVELDQLLETSDFVSVHLRLSDKTKKFMGKREFAQMKKTAYFINTARAGLVDTEALTDALKNREIGGAAIDVFDQEPLPKGHPYLNLENVTLTSHLAGTSSDTPVVSVEIAVQKLKDYLTRMAEEDNEED